jgi:hypothetical protein
LPADGVNRLVLLAPSVYVAYDLRPALRAARGGIDVFHRSEHTVAALMAATGQPSFGRMSCLS